jgi:uncharacterized protein
MPLLYNSAEYPSEFALHKKYAPTEVLLELVWNHTQMILDIGLTLYDAGTFNTSDIPRPLLVKAILFHDIGVYRCGGFEWIPGQPINTRPYIQHTVAGGEILINEGFGNDIVRVAQVHTGVGLTEQEITMYGLDLPAGDYTPVTNLEWFVTYISKFHSKTPKFRTAEEIEKNLLRYGPDKVERWHQLQAFFGLPDVAYFQKKYEDWHRGFSYTMKQITQNATSLNNASLSQLSPSGISLSLSH